jgi:menaquinone-dependent protoporphyrinogen oxidase
VFGGYLDMKKITFIERALIRMVKAEPGEYRDLDAIAAWARDIAEALKPAAS